MTIGPRLNSGEHGQPVSCLISSALVRWSMRRREFIALAGGVVAWPSIALAQQHGKLQRIGLLIPVSEASAGANVDALLRGLGDLGYVQGFNVALEYRYANGKDNLLPGFAAELVKAGGDVIVTWGTPAALADKQEQSKRPIVMAAIADPIGTDIVQSVARPGGNITDVLPQAFWAGSAKLGQSAGTSSSFGNRSMATCG